MGLVLGVGAVFGGTGGVAGGGGGDNRMMHELISVPDQTQP